MSKEESWIERYWRLRREANELYQKQMKEMTQKIKETTKSQIQKELDAMESAIRRGNLIEAMYHQMVLEVLMK
jgi:hypothetical protein